ncbi:hypothetical protein B0H17DRAFT_1200575 [Mycena rosella]|uniref:ZZ-type domain-containing protein n=1 Tax=Mycena rosella TaxID=1033263 RepID=A0AAD7DIS6_MYCRO|nr:hypothetical protein B0H17DRAFT_1200575 [Mycena rosella]
MPSISSLPSGGTTGNPSPATDYTCDGCAQPIPPTHPRLHCLICADHDLCAVCALGCLFVGAHTATHAIAVYRTSGGSMQGAVVSQISISYGADISSGTLPTSGSSPGGTAVPIHEGAPTATDGWQRFFHQDMSPTPTFTGLMDAIFTYLDPSNTGCLMPETFSRLLDDMGNPTHENAWKANLNASFGRSKEDAADAALKSAFDAFSIDHVCHPRPRASGRNFFGGSAAAGPMPLITRRGLVDITAVELLSDPAGEFSKLARLVGLYMLQPYSTWGAMPRGVLPPNPDPRMLARVAAAQSSAQRNGQQAFAAAQMSANIQAYANQVAVHAVGTTEYVYR